MGRIPPTVAVLAMLLAGCPARRTPAPEPTTRPARVVVISIDGLMPGAYLDPDAHGLEVPTLRAMRDGGAYARAVEPVFPTITYPAHTTIVTGVEPAVHGITVNHAVDPLDKNLGGWRWYSEDIAVPTLWQAVEAAGRPVALVTWPVTAGADVTYLVPEYWRAGTADDQKLVRSLSTPGLLEEVAAVEPALWTHLVPPDVHDEAPFAIAAYLLSDARVPRPELVLVHAWAVDDAQHLHGPWSAEANVAIERADRLLGELLAGLERSADWARTIVVVVSDHGMAPVSQQIRLEALFVERGLIRLDAAGKPIEARVSTVAGGGTILVYLDDPAAAGEVEAALASVGDPIARIHGHDQLVALGADPGAAYLVEAAPGYQFSASRTGPIVLPSTGKGDHGLMPSDPAMAAGLIVFGPSVEPRELGTIRMVDLAPTLAAWLGVELPAATGRPIVPLSVHQSRR